MGVMDATAGPEMTHVTTRASEPGTVVRRHSITTRVTHWVAFLAIVVLTMSGLQIFNAAPYLDASDKSDPAHRVLSLDGQDLPGGGSRGTTTIFGHTFTTTHWLGYTDDGQGGETPRGFPGWITFPGYQDLAGGRRWHFFFAWIFVLAGGAYIVAGLLRKELPLLVLRPSDLPKMWPMQAYYFRLRKDPPDHGKYNPLQKAGYTLVIFVLAPFVVITGLALAPGFDSIAQPLVWLLGGRQFARTWHFVSMLLLCGFFFGHVFLVASTGFLNNMRSMTLGTYRLGKHEGTGP
jgi:thiosulfate reductase cytochrome b subunit